MTDRSSLATNPHQGMHYAARDDDEINLRDLIVFLKHSWRWIVSAGIVGALAGATYGVLAPDRYSASANLQMATLANEPVELPATLAEKLKMPSYYPEAVFSECGLEDKKRPGEILTKALKPTVSRSAPLVNISFERSKPSDAARCLEAVLNHVSRQQGAIVEPVVTAKRAQLEALRQRLKDSEALRLQLVEKNKHVSSMEKGAGSSAMFSGMVANSNEINNLIKEIGTLQLLIIAPQTRRTSLAAPIYVTQTLTVTKRLLIALAFMLAGIFIGTGMVTIRNVWRNLMRERSAISLTPTEDFSVGGAVQLAGGAHSQPEELRRKNEQTCDTH